jgi:hypothetical protein
VTPVAREEPERVLVMPLLAVLADIVGIFGGALVMSFWPLPILHSSIAISG